MPAMGRRVLGALLAIVAALAIGAAALPATADPNLARPFTPTPLSPPLYDVAAPFSHIVEAGDGVDLYVEVWLPAAKGGNVPPARVPSVLVITPYQVAGTIESTRTLSAVVARGYAYVQMHVRGFGNSGGCVDLLGAKEADDSARVVEWLGRDRRRSPTATSAAMACPTRAARSSPPPSRGDAENVKYLEGHRRRRAVCLGIRGALDVRRRALGVDWHRSTPPNYMGQTILPRPGARCQSPRRSSFSSGRPAGPSTSLVGRRLQRRLHAALRRARDPRSSCHGIKAAVLMTHGHADLVPIGGVPPMAQAGLFDKIPATTPKAGHLRCVRALEPARAATGSTR